MAINKQAILCDLNMNLYSDPKKMVGDSSPSPKLGITDAS